MSGEFLFDVYDDSPPEDLSRGIQDIYGMLRGDLFAAMGAPLRATQHAGTGYSNIFATTEPTLGESFQAFDGLSNLGLQVDNNGVYGEMPTELTDTLTVGVDVLIGRDAVVTRDVSVGRDLAVVGDTVVGDDLHVIGDAVVDLTTTLTGIVGVGQAPTASVALGVTGKQKNTGDLWITGKLGVGEDAATNAFRLTGDMSIVGDILPRTDNARSLGSSSLQWKNIFTEALTADAVTLVVDPTNHRVGFGIAAPTVANDFLGVVQMDLHTAVPTFYLDPTNHWVGILTATPKCPVDVLGTARVLSATATAPGTGKGMELFFDSSADVGVIQSFDRDGATWKETRIRGEISSLYTRSTARFVVGQTGIAFFAGAQAAKQTVSGVRTGTLAQLQTVMANLLTALSNYTFITDSTT